MKKILVIGLLLTACNSQLDTVPEPDDLLSETQMAEVMKDLMILEGHVHLTYESVNRYHKIMTESGKALLKSRHISEKQYEDSFTYYNAHPSEFEHVLDQIMDELNKESILLQQDLKDTLEKTKATTPPVVNDSLNVHPTLNP